jgi:capsule polysaccharide export protein KpsE/RkpR
MFQRLKTTIHQIWNQCDQTDLITKIEKDLVAAKSNLLWAHVCKEDAEHNIQLYTARVDRLTKTLANEKKNGL